MRPTLNTISQNLHDRGTSMLSFYHLYHQVKNAGMNQKTAAFFVDPLQGKVDEGIQTFVESSFTAYVKKQHTYKKMTSRSCNHLFPTSEAFIEKLKKGEDLAQSIERRFLNITRKNRSVLTAYIIGVAILIGSSASCFTLNPVKLCIIYGIYFTAIHNHSAIPYFLKDVQLVCNTGKLLLQKSLHARHKIRQIGKNVASLVHPNLEKETRPDFYHLKTCVSWALSQVWGTKEEIQESLDETLNAQISSKIRRFEKKLRHFGFKKVVDASLIQFSYLTISQVAKLFFTNLTGLGAVAIIFYATYPVINDPSAACSLTSPLIYTWNHLFPFGYLFSFSETCSRYSYLLTASDIIKWGLRFYIWNKMIQHWQVNRASYIQDNIRLLQEKSQNKWNDLIIAFQEKSSNANSLVLDSLSSIKDLLSWEAREDQFNEVLPQQSLQSLDLLRN